jgi:hypothetical protein
MVPRTFSKAFSTSKLWQMVPRTFSKALNKDNSVQIYNL